MNQGLIGIVLGGVGAGLLLSTGSVFASDDVSLEAPKVDSRLDDLSFFAQDWQCELEEKGDLAKLKTSSFQLGVTRELNDFWFLGQVSTPERGIFERETLGFNTIMEKFGRTVIGDDGKFANFLSEGWDGETLTWEGRVANMATKTMAKHRIVVTKTSDHAFMEKEYAPLDDQDSWELISSKSCVVEKSS